jgi:hypothetical protein
VLAKHKSRTPASKEARAHGSTSLYKPSSVSRPGHPEARRRSFLYDGDYPPPPAAYPQARASNPSTRRHRFPAACRHACLCGLAPNGVCLAVRVTAGAVGSYSAISPLPSGRREASDGGFFSVALSSALPPPGVTRHRALWSSDFPPATPKRERTSARAASTGQFATAGDLAQAAGTPPVLRATGRRSERQPCHEGRHDESIPPRAEKDGVDRDRRDNRRRGGRHDGGRS